METQTQMASPVQKSGGAKDFFINLGAFVSLYALVVSLLNLLFTVINVAYPQISRGYNYYSGSQSISWPVSTLIIFFPIFILLMWLLEREYRIHPEKQSAGIHKWLTYITLFVAGITIAGDLITVLYYFIDGQELTTGFLLKVLVVLIVAGAIFAYYISDIAGKLTAFSRKVWRVAAAFIILGSIVWGFVVLGSPRTQQLLKYDQQRISDLQTLDNQVRNFYYSNKALPKTISDLTGENYYGAPLVDPQSKQPYEYEKVTDAKYKLCAEFNRASTDSRPSLGYDSYGYGDISWTHPEGRHCFEKSVIPENDIKKPLPITDYEYR